MRKLEGIIGNLKEIKEILEKLPLHLHTWEKDL